MPLPFNRLPLNSCFLALLTKQYSLHNKESYLYFHFYFSIINSIIVFFHYTQSTSHISLQTHSHKKYFQTNKLYTAMAYLWFQNDHRSMEQHIRKWVYFVLTLIYPILLIIVCYLYILFLLLV